MSDELEPLDAASPFDAIKRTRPDGKEFWSARDIQAAVEYVRWEDFAKAVDRALRAAENSGHEVVRSFSAITEKPEGGGRPRQDYLLSRFGAYLTVMNCDPSLEKVAAGQAYFAIKTREAEVGQQAAQISPAEQMALGLIAAQQLIEQKDARIDELSRKVEEDAPKVAYIDVFVADSDLLKLRTVAADLEVQETWLRELLLRKGWIYSETETRWSNSKGCKETTTRYSAYAEKKRYFRPVPVHEAPRFRGEVMHTLKVTPLGATAISRLVAKELAA